jgi:predicted metal-dependent phosphoesterase TrpH
VVGPNPPARTIPGGLTPEETVEMAHERGCAAIIAHPYRNSTVREADADFDAIEVNGKGTDPIRWVEQLAENRDLPLVGGSDAHYPVEVGRAYTEVEADELTPESLATAIQDGRVQPCVDRSPSQRLLRRAYKFIHGQKGWLSRPELEPPGLGTPPGEEDQAPPPQEAETGESRRQ